MRALSRKEIDRILAKGRILLDHEITAILDEFQEKQPEIYQAIYIPKKKNVRAGTTYLN
jgi:hypothetical protein